MPHEDSHCIQFTDMPDSATITESPATATFDIEGMSCASCVSHVKKAAESVPGVQTCDVNLAGGSATVRFNRAADPDVVADAITDAGYPARPRDDQTDR